MPGAIRLRNRCKYAPPLSSEGYAEGFKAFKRISSECEAMLGWIERTLRSEIPENDNFAILSVGCGSGDFDLELIQILKTRIPRIDYVAVEPNHVHCQQSAERLVASPLEGIRCVIHPVPFEEFHTDERFDLIHFTHCLYYIPDREAAILHAVKLLVDGGRVVVFHQTPMGINQIQRKFLKRTKGDTNEMFSSKDLEEILDRNRIPYRLEVLDSTLDITDCFGLDSKMRDTLLSFFLECDVRELDPATKQGILSYLQELSFYDQERRLIYHPVAIFSIFKRVSK